MPNIHTTVITTPVIVAVMAPDALVIVSIFSPPQLNNPTIISLQIRAMMNPKAAATAVAIVDFTSPKPTIFFTSFKLSKNDINLDDLKFIPNVDHKTSISLPIAHPGKFLENRTR
jgi:hypothetical protein